MYEIPFVSKDVLNPNRERRAQLQTNRMAEMVAIAKRLSADGWAIEWTVTGLAIQMPYDARAGLKEDQIPGITRQKLMDMGIADELRLSSSRSLLELVTAKSEYADRSWYAETDNYVRELAHRDELWWDDIQFMQESHAKMLHVEDRYDRKELIVEGDYQRGTLKGRKEAFDWLLGEEWPELEPEDEFEAEEAEVYRAHARQEQAIDGLHMVLFGEQAAKTGESEQAGSTQPVLADTPATNAMPTDAT